ncbi:MAG TPA: serine/threonine-protein kinase [Myxococcaceae bacterium]|nr:serine/threonine-protein kinase [Myxococcaceae bacterium]
MSERYRLHRLLGGGGMAEVYLGMSAGEEGFEKPVAIKRVLPHLSRDEQVAKMFIGEAKLATQLHHQNIVEVFDVGRGPDGLFLVMELIDGWDLSVVFSRCAKQATRLPQVLAVHIAGQVASGLCHAYRRTLNGKPLIAAHRDISPSNILVSVEGEVKVADFGIARLEQLSHSKTEPGTFKGKIPYAAPEVIRGEHATPASDQFALGIVLHKMLVGRHPFGHMDNLVLYSETLARAQTPPMIGVPEALAHIVQRMLAMKPEERFGSMEDVLHALQTYLASAGVPASASELARFIQGLEMPPTPRHLLAQDPDPEVYKEKTKTARRQPPSSAELNLEELGSWKNDGPALDASGKLERGENPPSFEPVSAHTPSHAFAGTAARVANVAASTPVPFDPSGPPEVKQPHSFSQAENLELADDAMKWLQRPEAREQPPPEFVPSEAPAPRRGGGSMAKTLSKLVLGLFLLLIGAGFVVVKFRLWQPAFLAKLQRGLESPTPMLQLDSMPEGATVKINGEDVGRTPLFLDNVYPKGAQVEVKLFLPNHKVWTGTFTGGENANIEVKLTKR